LPLRARPDALRELRGPTDAALFAQVSVFAACVPLLLRLPLPRLAALLDAGARRLPAPAATSDRLPELLVLAARVFRPLVRPGCLTRGVTLFWFLRRSGLPVELCFAVDPTAEPADGHCWLVLDGEPFLEPVDPRARFAETYRLAPARR
jgi:hypothetical protein